MKPWKLSEAAKILNASFKAGKGDTEFKGVSADSRHINPQDLFIAIKGETVDGHSFLKEVEQKGAAGALVSEYQAQVSLPQIVEVAR